MLLERSLHKRFFNLKFPTYSATCLGPKLFKSLPYPVLLYIIQLAILLILFGPFTPFMNCSVPGTIIKSSSNTNTFWMR